MASKLCARALAFLVVASAGEISSLQDTEKQFAAFDKDGDGKITKHEFSIGVHHADATEDQVEELFSEGDANSDGLLVLEEFAKVYEDKPESPPAMLEFATESAAQSLLSKLDVDKDGKISLSELVTYSDLLREKSEARDMQRAWKAFDKNKDGKVSFEEFYGRLRHFKNRTPPNETDHTGDDGKKHEDHTKAIFAGADADGDGALELGEFANLYKPASSPAMMELAGKTEAKRRDRDGDGLISQEEFEEFSGIADSAGFARLDKDGSGKLDPSELVPVATRKFGVEQAMEAAIREADKDGDGHVSLLELAGAKGHLAAFAAQAQHGGL